MEAMETTSDRRFAEHWAMGVGDGKLQFIKRIHVTDRKANLHGKSKCKIRKLESCRPFFMTHWT